MRASLLIYTPGVLLGVAALVLPQMGPDLARGWHCNAHELAVVLAFMWMALCCVWRLLAAVVRNRNFDRFAASHRPNDPRGFDVMRKDL